VYSHRRRSAAKRVDAVAHKTREIQRKVVQSVSANLIPLLFAGAATFLVARSTRRAF
jgi:hypothetical protein